MRRTGPAEKFARKAVSLPEGVFKELVATFKTLHGSCHEALMGQWDRSDEGVESMMFLIEQRFADLGIAIPDYTCSEQIAGACPDSGVVVEKVKPIFAGEVEVTDPVDHVTVILGVYKDPGSGGMFGVDASFIEHTDSDGIPSPFTPGTVFEIEDM